MRRGGGGGGEGGGGEGKLGMRPWRGILAVVLGHTHHEGFEVWISRRATWRLALLRAVKLLGHEFPDGAFLRCRAGRNAF